MPRRGVPLAPFSAAAPPSSRSVTAPRPRVGGQRQRGPGHRGDRPCWPRRAANPPRRPPGRATTTAASSPSAGPAGRLLGALHALVAPGGRPPRPRRPRRGPPPLRGGRRRAVRPGRLGRPHAGHRGPGPPGHLGRRGARDPLLPLRPDARRREPLAPRGPRGAPSSTLLPDTGPDRPHPSGGAMAVGARGPLVAYNLWVRGSRLAETRAVAARVRGPALRALGLAGRAATQVSCNLVDPSRSGPADAYDLVAAALPGAGRIVRAELVGLVPEAVLDATPHGALGGAGPLGRRRPRGEDGRPLAQEASVIAAARRCSARARRSRRRSRSLMPPQMPNFSPFGQGVLEAVLPDDATPADLLGLPRRRPALGEEEVGVDAHAVGLCLPAAVETSIEHCGQVHRSASPHCKWHRCNYNHVIFPYPTTEMQEEELSHFAVKSARGGPNFDHLRVRLDEGPSTRGSTPGWTYDRKSRLAGRHPDPAKPLVAGPGGRPGAGVSGVTFGRRPSAGDHRRTRRLGGNRRSGQDPVQPARAATSWPGPAIRMKAGTSAPARRRRRPTRPRSGPGRQA